MGLVDGLLELLRGGEAALGAHVGRAVSVGSFSSVVPALDVVVATLSTRSPSPSLPATTTGTTTSRPPGRGRRRAPVVAVTRTCGSQCHPLRRLTDEEDLADRQRAVDRRLGEDQAVEPPEELGLADPELVERSEGGRRLDVERDHLVE